MNTIHNIIPNCRGSESVPTFEKDRVSRYESSSHAENVNNSARVQGDLNADDSFDLILGQLDNDAINIPTVNASEDIKPQSDKLFQNPLF